MTMSARSPRQKIGLTNHVSAPVAANIIHHRAQRFQSVLSRFQYRITLT